MGPTYKLNPMGTRSCKLDIWITRSYEYLSNLGMATGAYWSSLTSKNLTSEATAIAIPYPWRNRSLISSGVLLQEISATYLRSLKISRPFWACASQSSMKTSIAAWPLSFAARRWSLNVLSHIVSGPHPHSQFVTSRRSARMLKAKSEGRDVLSEPLLWVWANVVSCLFL